MTSLIYVFGKVLKVKLFSSDLVVESEHIFSLIFEVRGGIEAVRDEEAVGGLGGGDVSLGNGNELLLNLAEHVEGNFNFLLWVVGLNSCAHNCNIIVFLADAVHRGHHHHVDVCIKDDLPFLRPS